jgi:hypothetical protein
LQRAQKSSTFATSEGYTLEGPSKTGMKAVRKQAVMANAKKGAVAASSAAAAPATKKK